MTADELGDADTIDVANELEVQHELSTATVRHLLTWVLSSPNVSTERRPCGTSTMTGPWLCSSIVIVRDERLLASIIARIAMTVSAPDGSMLSVRSATPVDLATAVLTHRAL